MLLGCISLLAGPWSLAKADERGGGAGFWEPWVYVWLLGCATVIEGTDIVWGSDQKWMLDGIVYGWMFMAASHFLSLRVIPSKRQPWSLAFLGGYLRRLQQYAGLSHRPFLSAFLFQYAISIKKMSIIFWGERQFLCLLPAHCLWQAEQRVGVGALCLSFAVSSTRLGQQLPNLGVRVSVSWPLTYLAQGLNSFHCFYPWGSGNAHMEKPMSVVDSRPPSPAHMNLGICVASDRSSPHYWALLAYSVVPI